MQLIEVSYGSPEPHVKIAGRDRGSRGVRPESMPSSRSDVGRLRLDSTLLERSMPSYAPRQAARQFDCS